MIVHVRRYEDGVRRVETVAEVTGMEGNTPQLQDIFQFQRTGRKGKKVAGRYVATGIVPHVAEDLRSRGLDVPMQLFTPSQLVG